MELESLFARYDRLVLFDTETTGLAYSKDEIIEFAAVVLERREGKVQVMETYDELITLRPGGFVPAMIENSRASPTRISGSGAFPKPGSAVTSPGCSPATPYFWPTMPILI